MVTVPPCRRPAAHASGSWLAGEEVHVWQASLDAESARPAAFGALLSAGERARAERLVSAGDRARFVVAHGLLRCIVAPYAGAAPEALSFRCGPHGKPELCGPPGARGVRFSMAHSRGTVLYAVAKGRRVGIDVEAIRLLDVGSVARRFFSPEERAALDSLPGGRAIPAFFRAWTLKEAYSKARGRGTSLPFDRFTVTLAPGRPAVLHGVEGEPDEPSRWSLCDVDVGEGWAGALAVEGRSWSLKRRTWPAGDAAR